jgi:hypothetical protein
MYSTRDSENLQLCQQYRGNIKTSAEIEKLFMPTKIITDIFRNFWTETKLCVKTRNNSNVSGAAQIWVSRANFIPKKTESHKINEALKYTQICFSLREVFSIICNFCQQLKLSLIAMQIIFCYVVFTHKKTQS